MDGFEYSKHTIDMIIEREIQDSWISDTVATPDNIEYVSDVELHYTKKI